jgi:hypothetical protein
MKQSAVEWLIEQILEIPLEEATNVAHLKKYVNKVTVFEQAKEMEKQQIIEAYNKVSMDTPEQYYNKTFYK